MMGLICPICKSPTRPLAIGRYCPKDCDKKPQSGDNAILVDRDGKRWWMLCQDPNEKIPENAVSTWQLCEDDLALSSTRISWTDLVNNWQKRITSIRGNPGSGGIQSGNRYKRLVFWPL